MRPFDILMARKVKWKENSYLLIYINVLFYLNYVCDLLNPLGIKVYVKGLVMWKLGQHEPDKIVQV